MNAADLEMANLERIGNREVGLASQGICAHGWLSAPDGQPCTCKECGKTWPTESQCHAERLALLAGKPTTAAEHSAYPKGRWSK